MQTNTALTLTGIRKACIALIVPILLAFMCVNAQAFSLTVTGSDGAAVLNYRWMVEADTTNITIPGYQVPNGTGDRSISIDIHNSYAPVLAKGHSTTSTVNIDLPSDTPYFVTVMPDAFGTTGVSEYALSGTTVSVGQSAAAVTVNRMPLPTAQIYLIAFLDHNPISNAKDEREDGLGGVSIYLDDFSGGRLAVDAFGNPLGTIYETDIFGQPLLGPDGAPIVQTLGDGALTTLSQDDIDAGNNPYNLKLGEALIKNLAPGKYGVRMVPPAADDSGNPLLWSQTATIEGTPTIDAWVQAGEPKLFVEGFGTGVWHAFFGFVNYTPSSGDPWIVKGQTVTSLQGNVLNETGNPAGTGSISGTVRYNHFNRPPNVQGLNLGPIVDQCWVGLNDAILIAEAELVPIGPEVPVEVIDALKPSAGLYAVPCDENGNFTFTGIPAGEYQLVTWDTPLDALFGTNTVSVPAGASGTGDDVDVGDVLSFRWFGTLEGTVFYDENQDGRRDPGELGMMDQAVNLRFRDGSIYQATGSGADGSYSLSEVFPFFKWLVPEVDFARFKATGMTTAIDFGGPIPDLLTPVWPSNGNKSLQPQVADPELNVFGTTDYRTEQGPVLTTAMHLLLNQTNLIDWGKVDYGPNENGGISGVVFYDTTRAEDDPKYNGGEPWQPGIPRVQLNLYRDAVNNASGFPPSDGIIDDIDGSGTITTPDVDNYPFDWTEGGAPGPEDVDDGFTGAQIASGDGVFDMRDAIEVTWSDSWDDNKPSGCVQTPPALPAPRGFPIPECADGYGTWNQVRPGVFDGGYAFGPEIDCSTYPDGICPAWVNQTDAVNNIGYLKPGDYIVEAVPPPNYNIVKSQDKNVDFGELFIPSPLLLPPECVGEPYVVPAELTLFPGIPANLAGQSLNNCDRKLINLSSGENSAGDFFMFTEVPKAARVFGFANNDLGAEFNQASPIFGEKLAVPWIPVAFRDWAGNELFRVYADEWGHYNALLPSTYTINAPSASGVAPNMITMVLNDPIKPDGTVDLWYNPDYSVTPWTFNYQPGTTTYTDTPMVPVAAFTTAEVGLDTNQVNFGPVIGEVYATAAGPGSGPVICTDTNPLPATVTLTSLGNTEILNPDWDPAAVTPGPRTIFRDYGFGGQTADSQVTLDGVPVPIVTWTDSTIVVTIDAGSTGGTLMVTRGNGISTELGVNLNVTDCSGVIRVPGDYSTIQAAVDAAPYTANGIGPLILVAPGTYNENVIINKPVRLQGAGAGTTFINGNPTPASKLDAWHARIEPPVSQGGYNGQALEDFMLKNPFSENEAPVIIVFGEQFFPDGVIGAFGDLPLANVFNPGFRFGTEDDLVLPNGTPRIPFEGVGAPVAGEAIPGQSLIDGFKLSGSKAGGGIYVFTRVRGIQISNNEIVNNQGNYSGGISVGVPDAGFQMYDEDDFRFRTAGFQNTDVVIKHNKIHKNSGFQGSGGIAVSEDSHRYLIEDNLIIGNFSRFHGGGIAHIGRSDDVMIKDNKILFNENFFGAILLRAGDGGGIYVGGDLAGGTGSGNVTIDGNLIQGNMTGSGSGGGIRVNAMSGLDVFSISDPDLICEDSANCPFPWPLFRLTLTNNVIINNIAGLDGGGISLQDVSRGLIAHNTIANNDSTAVGRRAFPAGQISSIPMPAGVAAHPHSGVLQYLWEQAQIQPLLGTAGKVLEFCIEGLPNDPGFENPPECTGTPDPTFPDLTIANNIIWHNNSWFFNGTTIDPGTGGIQGSLDPNPDSPYWDIGLFGSTTDFMDPQGGILSSLADVASPGHIYTGNLVADPLFVFEYLNTIDAATVIDEGGNNINMRFTPLPGDAGGLVADSDYHIAAGSPAIDAPVATASSLPILALDVDDEARPAPAGAGVDVGADEYLALAPPPCPADLSGDGLVNFADLALLRANFGNPICSPITPCPGDITGDGLVNFADLAALRAAFGVPCP